MPKAILTLCTELANTSPLGACVLMIADGTMLTTHRGQDSLFLCGSLPLTHPCHNTRGVPRRDDGLGGMPVDGQRGSRPPCSVPPWPRAVLGARGVRARPELLSVAPVGARSACILGLTCDSNDALAHPVTGVCHIWCFVKAKTGGGWHFSAVSTTRLQLPPCLWVWMGPCASAGRSGSQVQCWPFG